MNGKCYSRRVLGLYIFLAGWFLTHPVLAQGSVNDVAENITVSASQLPGLVAALFYLIGLLLAVTGIFKIVEHVGNPSQTPLRVPLIRLIAGGACFALPIIYEAVSQTISGGNPAGVDSGELGENMNSLFSGLSGISGANVSSVFENIVNQTNLLPALVSAVAYLLALLNAGLGIIKIKDHVEDPNSAPLKDGIINFLIAGAMFALPTVFEAAYISIAGSGLGVWESAAGAWNQISLTMSGETGNVECDDPVSGADATLGNVVCHSWLSSLGIVPFLSALSYMLGLIMGVWGLVKIRIHVIDPRQSPLWEGMSRLFASGAFFALPPLVAALQFSLLPNDALALQNTRSASNTTFRSDGTASCGTTNALDEAMACFMHDMLGPLHVGLNFFAIVAGIIFIMIGISRLLKSAQDGPRGSGGLGTVTTFVVGAILLSSTTLLRALSSSLFGSPVTTTMADLLYAEGMSIPEQEAVYNVVDAVLKFLIIVGMISFVRGIFIMRDVAEGSQQASTMAGLTHIVGGALAVNLGPLLNAVQQTLGITAFGMTFS